MQGACRPDCIKRHGRHPMNKTSRPPPGITGRRAGHRHEATSLADGCSVACCAPGGNAAVAESDGSQYFAENLPRIRGCGYWGALLGFRGMRPIVVARRITCGGGAREPRL
jgi:hypothetical protein